MKHLILILSLSLMGALANAGGADMSTNCPFSQATRFAKTHSIQQQAAAAAATRAAKARATKQSKGKNSN